MMTDEEKVFEMVERCIADAVLALENGTPLTPSAKLLTEGGEVRDLSCGETDEQRCYETLLQHLRTEVKAHAVDAVALTARVTIPDYFNPASTQGVRVHLEEKADLHKKHSARLLYVPYELYAVEGSDKRSVMLHQPIAVGMPMEVYGQKT